MISFVFIRKVARPQSLVSTLPDDCARGAAARITTSPLNSRSNVTALPVRSPRYSRIAFGTVMRPFLLTVVGIANIFKSIGR